MAAKKAEEEYQKCKLDIHNKGQEALRYIEENNLEGIVLVSICITYIFFIVTSPYQSFNLFHILF